MKNVVLYAHGGSGNHGCEALVRTTADLIYRETRMLPSVISSRPAEDQKYINDLAIQFIPKGSPMNKFQRVWAKAYKSVTGSLKYYDYIEMKAISRDTRDSLCISIGGDNYCYSDYEYYGRMNSWLLENGNSTVLWGCSVEPELLKNKAVLEDLSRYSLITARESITCNAMKNAGLNNVEYCPDSAFLLEPQATALPHVFQKEVVGINVSPMVLNYEKDKGMVMQNYIELIRFVLESTDYNIALIPHVVWNFSDDLGPLSLLYDQFKDSERVELVDREKKLNARQLKYLISKCSFLVASRTHASIAGYSSGIPTLVVGYSIKANGIARDIFGNEDKYVCSVQKMNKSVVLKKYFESILNEISEENACENKYTLEVANYLKKVTKSMVQLNI